LEAEYGLENHMEEQATIQPSDEKSVLYEQVTDVNLFPYQGLCFLLLSLRLLLLSTGFVFAL